MAITTTIKYTMDLGKGGLRDSLRSPLSMLNSKAHTFAITVLEDGAAASLTGAACRAWFIRADGVTVPIDGTVSGNVASVTLLPNCYAVQGRFELAVELTLGDVIHTILHVDGSILRTRTDSLTTGGSAVQSFDQLMTAFVGHENALSKRDRVQNLLVNPFFQIAQPGYHALHGTRYYAADRWIENAIYPTGGVTFDPVSGLAVTVPSAGRATIQQYIPNQDTTGTYTIAAKAGGVVYVASGKPSSANVTAGNTADFRIILSVSNNLFNVQLDAFKDITIEWALVYPGAYTEKDLPAPVRNDYSHDLLACQHYALYLAGGTVRYASTQVTSAIIDFTLPLPVAMRVKPSIANGTFTVYSGGTAQDGFTFTVNAMDSNALSIRAEKAGHGLTGAMLSLSNVLLSADL